MRTIDGTEQIHRGKVFTKEDVCAQLLTPSDELLMRSSAYIIVNGIKLLQPFKS